MGEALWAELAPRLLHPIQVQIIEALRWIGLPLTAADLLQVFERKGRGLRIERHLQRLTKLGATTLEGRHYALLHGGPLSAGEVAEIMNSDCVAPPKYNPKLVGEAILLEIVEQHPIRLTVGELALRIVADPDDGMEVETATHAIRDLRRSGLVRYRNDDQVVEPTQAALCAHDLLDV
jgi:DNA-binding transcriptional ArsR family regulator